MTSVMLNAGSMQPVLRPAADRGSGANRAPPRGCPAIQLSANRRSTSPVRGWPKDVDLRGTIAPCAATSYTSAADIGAHRTASAPGSRLRRPHRRRPGRDRPDRRLVVADLPDPPHQQLLQDGRGQMRATAWPTSRRIAAATRPGSGSVSSAARPSPASTNATPRDPAAASSASTAGTSAVPPASSRTVNAAAASARRRPGPGRGRRGGSRPTAAGRRPSRPAGPGRSPTARPVAAARSLLQLQVGRVAVMPVGDQRRPARRSAAIAASSAASVMPHSRCRDAVRW